MSESSTGTAPSLCDENMHPEYTKEYPPEVCDENVIAFLANRDLEPIKKVDRERREDHDRRYQKYISKEKNARNIGAGAPKKYREDMYNNHSVCDAQFINNLHHYKTCDGGSGYRAEHKHYAMDFISENPCGPSDRNKLKSLKRFSKNRTINDWLNREDNPLPRTMRRSFSCIDLSEESLALDEGREEIAEERRYKVDFRSSINHIDPSFLPENRFGVDTSKLLAELSLSMKFMVGHVNTQAIPLGDVKISKVLFSTEDLYAYVLLENFNQEKAIKTFSEEFEKWHKGLPKEAKCGFGGAMKQFVNVVLFLEQYVDEKTAFRRARHVCRLPSPDVSERRFDLYIEIDTGMLRAIEWTPKIVRCMPKFWAGSPSAVVEVRFYGAKTEDEVASHIDAIRRTGVAKAVSVDKRKLKHFPHHWSWNTVDTVVLQTYRPTQLRPSISSLFCADKDCMGMCHTDAWFEKPTPVNQITPASEKLTTLRDKFEKALDSNQNRVNLSAYIIPYTDAHQNENIPEHFARLKFLSDFTGTVGVALVTGDKAILWTDDMHFRIAQRELDKEWWTSVNKNEKGAETIVEWLRRELAAGSLVGFDPMLITYSFFLDTSRQLASAGIRLVPIASNLIDELWLKRPFQEGDVVKVLSIQECGLSPERKLKRLRDELRLRQFTATVITTLDDIMWLLNMRGNDLPFSPLAYSYLFVTMQEVHLFIDPLKIDRDAKAHLTRFDVTVHSYKNAHSVISEWFEAKRKDDEHPCVYLTADTNHWIGAIFGEVFSIVDKSILKDIKAKKNRHEIEGMRESSLRDSVAMVEFLCWLEREMSENKRVYSEDEIAEKLESIKRQHPSYEGRSCPTMFSSGQHSSKPSYLPNSAHIVSNLFQYLVKAGGHYKNGTTSVTRTVWDTLPTPEYVSTYTMVLKGHIQLAAAQFPMHMTYGSQLDAFAKHSIWMQGLDSVRDTGHNVGHCLNMRDTQVIVGDTKEENDGLLEAGQVITLEPAFYQPDEYGIQIGNCYETIAEGQSLTFKPLTLVPIQTSVVIKSSLTQEEILWINQYHHTVFAEIGQCLINERKQDEWQWLKKACQPI